MERITKGVFLLVFLGVLLGNCSIGQEPFDAWLEDSLVKVFPDTAAPSEGMSSASITAPTLIAPRNGHTSIQLAIRPRAELADFGVRVSPGDPGSESILFRVRHVGYVPVKANTPDSPSEEIIRTAPAEFPDPLFEELPSTLKSDRTECFWITVKVPSELKPGMYSGKAEILINGRSADSLPFEIRVLEASVPLEGALKVTNWFNLGAGHLRKFFKIEEDSEEYWYFLENLAGVLGEHRQNVILTPVKSLVRASRKNGKFVYDFSRFDRWVEIFKKAGVIGTIEGGHLLTRPNGYFSPIMIPSFVIEDGEVVLKLLEPDDPRVEKSLTSFLSALYSHLKEKGWQDNYVQHIHDEPYGDAVPVYKRYAPIIRKQLPGIPTLDAVDLEENLDLYREFLDIWVPVLSSFDDKLDILNEHLQNGGTNWYYTCVNPQGTYLNRFIDYSSLKVRLLHWLNFRHNLTGYLHWGGNYWSEEPFSNVEPVINEGRTLLPAGDNALVYPDVKNLSVLSSIRFEVMLEGIEDYELLRSAPDQERARALVKSMIPEMNDYIRNVEEFRSIYLQLLESMDSSSN